jgi:deoxyhypusine synthase
MSLADMVEQCFSSFNARSLSDACRLFASRIVAEDVLVGWSLAGALVPAGLGRSSLTPMIRAGYVDWLVSTGANLYHDLHFSLGFDMFRGSPSVDDGKLLDDGVVRIHDLYFKADALYRTDAFIRDTFRRLAAEGNLDLPLSSADLHRILGEELLRIDPRAAEHSILAAAWEADVPVHTPAPGDSSTGMNLAALALEGIDLPLDPWKDINETAAYVYDAKTDGRKTAVVLLGGGTPKNFMLQTEPHIQEVLGLEDAGHDYFLQFTDARPDTGGLSGATPSEAVSWGKIDPTMLQNAVVCYGDCSVYLPILALYTLQRAPAREKRRLWCKRTACLERLTAAYREKKGSPEGESS